MNDKEIIERITSSLNALLTADAYLLTEKHLQRSFENYHVDCEYNGNSASPSSKKKIQILKETLLHYGLLTEGQSLQQDTDTVERSVFPDIIIHQRGISDKNLCILEIKKSTSDIPYHYDRIKLQAYTSNQYGNNLRYQLGVFVMVLTGSNELDYQLTLFKEGQEFKLLDQ
jgi:hypothetical protein